MMGAGEGRREVDSSWRRPAPKPFPVMLTDTLNGDFRPKHHFPLPKPSPVMLTDNIDGDSRPNSRSTGRLEFHWTSIGKPEEIHQKS